MAVKSKKARKAKGQKKPALKRLSKEEREVIREGERLLREIDKLEKKWKRVFGVSFPKHRPKIRRPLG